MGTGKGYGEANLTITPVPDYKVGDIVKISGIHNTEYNGTFVIKEIRFNHDIGKHTATYDLSRRERRKKNIVNDKWYLKYAKGTAR